MSSIEKAKMALARKSEIMKRAFSSPDGQEALAVLKEEFDSRNIFTPGDPYGTSYKLGSRDVVIYINDLLNYKGD